MRHMAGKKIKGRGECEKGGMQEGKNAGREECRKGKVEIAILFLYNYFENAIVLVNIVQ